MKNLPLFLCLSVFVVASFSCRRHTVTRIDPGQQVDLSGRWNDTDSRLVAKEMIDDCLNRPWIANFGKKNAGKKPVVIVGIINNKTAEHIESEVFIKNMEREYINTGLVRVVENATFREKLRQERADQQEFASPDTQKKWGRELGADYMMFGVITSITDSQNRKQVTFYQVNLELVDIETNEKVWIGEKQIKKFITN
ncbi:MAG: penicillin-binding protein activator LpoB [Verrucomicrobia bacterium]|nr:penicillin-binding protein activator LpoB [Cytophagales bacterium]